MDARLYWPGLGEVTPDELVLRQLLPVAHDGLRRWGVAGEVCDRYLGVIEGGAKTGRTGSSGLDLAGCDGSGIPGTGPAPPESAGRDAAALRGTHAQQRGRPHLGMPRGT